MGFLSSLGLGAATSAISSIFGGASQAIAAKQQYNYTKKLMEKQNQYQVAAYNQQRNDYVNDLLVNRSRDVQSLKSAGLNPALALDGTNGTTPLGAAPETPNMSFALPQGQMAEINPMLSAQLDNVKANTDKVKAETDATRTTTDKVKAEFDNWQTTTKDLFNNLLANQVLQSQQETAASAAEKNYTANYYDKKSARVNDIVTKEVEQLISAADLTTFNLDVQRKLAPLERKRVRAEIINLLSNADNLRESTNRERILNGFRKLGIGVGSGLLDGVAAMVSSGHGDELVKRVVGTVSSALSSLLDTEDSTYNMLTREVDDLDEALDPNDPQYEFRKKLSKISRGYIKRNYGSRIKFHH